MRLHHYPPVFLPVFFLPQQQLRITAHSSAASSPLGQHTFGEHSVVPPSGDRWPWDR